MEKYINNKYKYNLLKKQNGGSSITIILQFLVFPYESEEIKIESTSKINILQNYVLQKYKNNINPYFKLKYEGFVLDYNKIFEDYGINNKSTIYVTNIVKKIKDNYKIIIICGLKDNFDTRLKNNNMKIEQIRRLIEYSDYKNINMNNIEYKTLNRVDSDIIIDDLDVISDYEKYINYFDVMIYENCSLSFIDNEVHDKYYKLLKSGGYLFIYNIALYQSYINKTNNPYDALFGNKKSFDYMIGLGYEQITSFLYKKI